MKSRTPFIGHALVLLVVVSAACHEGPDAVAPSSARNGICAPSSVSHHASCPSHVAPAGTGSSPEGCKSDADCKTGHDGRCIGYGRAAFVRSNLLGAPPPPPPRSICVYDECLADAECAATARCACRSGVGSERNACVAVDGCLGDRDCSNDELCTCGSNAKANICAAGNCRADVDCFGGLGCGTDGQSGARFCRTPHDACHLNGDCKPSGEGSPVCVYATTSHAYACDVVLPAPPG